MGILARVGVVLQGLFGPAPQQAAVESGVIKRQRVFSALSLAGTFILGFLKSPKASAEKLARTAAQCGVAVTPQAIDNRHTPALVAFLQGLFKKATQLAVGSSKALAGILERFTSVMVLDSSALALPDEMQEQFPGCGGSHGGGAAALKLQTEWDLRSGALHVEVESGRSPDGTWWAAPGATPRPA